MDLAPIIIFAYNRPWHLSQTINALSFNDLANESDIFIHCDGAPEGVSRELNRKIEEVSKIAEQVNWCKSLNIIKRKKNIGLDKSIISFVTEIINTYDKVIVLEDDIITSKYFLKFMNNGLELFSKSENVYTVTGYMYPLEFPIAKSVLLPSTSAWGWGTWKNRWKEYDHEIDLRALVSGNKFLKNRFNIGDLDYTYLLYRQSEHWDIRWYYTLFKKNGLSLFPSKSLVKNIGFDSSGINCGSDERFSNQTQYELEIPIEKTDEIDLEFYAAYLNYHSIKKRKILDRAYSKLSTIFKK